MLENKFQANLIKELKERFPGCIVMKNDPTYIQGNSRFAGSTQRQMGFLRM